MLATKFGSNRTSITSYTAPLSESQLMSVVPSVFADSAHSSRSARYAHIPTIQVVKGLEKEGFRVFAATQGKSRIEGKEAFTKHMLRLRHVDQITGNGHEANEVILLNSHDGTSSYQMLAGCFRFVCANGLICGTTQADIRIKHSGNAVHDVVEGAYQVLSGFEEVDASKDAMRSLWLTDGEQSAFARAALALRFDASEKDPPIRAEQVVAPRRFEDQDHDLWTVFNCVQENLVTGGVRTRGRSGRGRGHTRAINGIDGNVALNRGLWVLAEEMRKLRTVAA